jgi:hypothetical protein
VGSNGNTGRSHHDGLYYSATSVLLPSHTSCLHHSTIAAITITSISFLSTRLLASIRNE